MLMRLICHANWQLFSPFYALQPALMQWKLLNDNWNAAPFDSFSRLRALSKTLTQQDYVMNVKVKDKSLS